MGNSSTLYINCISIVIHYLISMLSHEITTGSEKRFQLDEPAQLILLFLPNIRTKTQLLTITPPSPSLGSFLFLTPAERWPKYRCLVDIFPLPLTLREVQ